MRIALIQTPIEDFYFTPQRTYPLGLSYLAGAINNLSVEFEILDFLIKHGRQSISIPQEFKTIMTLLPYDRSPISAFHSYYHWGASWEKIADYFSKESYDLYAISSNFYTYSQEVLKVAEIIKSINPHSTVIVGGQNVGSEHKLFTQSEYIDICIQGEGETPFRELVKRLLRGQEISDIPGLWNSNLSIWNETNKDRTFPYIAAQKLLPFDKYIIAGEPSIMIATSRGCPMGCKFCSVSRTFGHKLRLRPVESILEEMQIAYDRGIRVFDIEDDNFTFIKEHSMDLLEKIIARFGNKISLYAMNGLSAEHLDEKIIQLLKHAGMKLLNLSIATSSKKQLELMNRHTNISHFQKIVQIAYNYKLKVMGHFIAGLPGQPLQEILETMKVLSELPLILGISPFYYIPGMKMEVPNIPNSCKEARLSRFWPADRILDENDLITLFRLSRWINYLKKQMLKKRICKLNFNEISLIFADDPFITSLITNSSFTGLDAKNLLYEHQHSKRVMNSFMNIFNNSYIYCTF